MPAYLTADGCHIHYDVFGDGGPWVALIPGLGGDGRFWAGVVDYLKADHQLLVLDHRGAGRSDRPAGPYSIRAIAADMAGVIGDIAGAVHIVGHSTGGAIAQELALEHRETGLSYTISSSWARGDVRFRTLFQARAELLDAGLAHTYQKLTHVFGYEACWIEENVVKLEAVVEGAAENLAPLSVTSARVRMLLDHDRLDDLSGVVAPVQVIAARDDILTPLPLSQAIADAIPDAALVIIPGAHFHPAADPAGFARIVRGFVAGHTRL